MGILKRLFGGDTKPQAPGRPAWITDGMKATLYVGHENLEVVGESNYQEALWRYVTALGTDTTNGVRVQAHAILAAEPDNPYDTNAVAVWVNGDLVGYLNRRDAGRLQPGVIRLHQEHGPVALSGIIVGGGSANMLGVFLEYDPSDFGLTTTVSEPKQATMRTGFTDAQVTDEADDTYDLSWFDRLPDGSTKRIVMLRSIIEKETTPISRHFALSMLEEDLYRSRDLNPGVLEEFDAVCTQHDSEMNGIRVAFITKFDSVPLLDLYRQMSIRKQKAGDLEAALWWTQRGLEVYGDNSARQEWVDDLQTRGVRYYNKLHPESR